MAQIALPFRIALVAVLVAGALWATVLRPKGADTASTPPPTAPGVAGLARAVDKANGAVAVSAAANAKVDAATGGQDATAASPAPGAQSAPAHTAAAPKPTALPVAGVAAGDPSVPLVRALGQAKVVVLLFAGTRAADDRAARQAMRGVSRHGGTVMVKVAAPRLVGDYEAITRGVNVNQFPTVLVIGPDKVAKPIVGFTTAGEVDQLVSDAVAAAQPARRIDARQTAAERRARSICSSVGDRSACTTFLVAANQSCTTAQLQTLAGDATGRTTGETPAARKARHRANVIRMAGALAAMQPPASLRTPHTSAVALMRERAKPGAKGGAASTRKLTRLGYGACA